MRGGYQRAIVGDIELEVLCVETDKQEGKKVRALSRRSGRPITTKNGSTRNARGLPKKWEKKAVKKEKAMQGKAVAGGTQDGLVTSGTRGKEKTRGLFEADTEDKLRITDEVAGRRGVQESRSRVTGRNISSGRKKGGPVKARGRSW